MAKLAFDIWMHKVDAWVWRLAGCSAYDLADATYKLWYADGMTPKAAAKAAIRYDRRGY